MLCVFVQACPEEEIVCDAPFNFEPDQPTDGGHSDLSPDDVKAMIIQEIAAYHPEAAAKILSSAKRK